MSTLLNQVDQRYWQSPWSVQKHLSINVCLLRSFLTSKSLSVLQPCMIGHNKRYVATLRYAVIAVFKKHLCLAYLCIQREKNSRKAVGLTFHTHALSLCIYTFNSCYTH